MRKTIWVVLDTRYALPVANFLDPQELAAFLKRARFRENTRIYAYTDGVQSSIGAVQWEYDEVVDKFGGNAVANPA